MSDEPPVGDESPLEDSFHQLSPKLSTETSGKLAEPVDGGTLEQPDAALAALAGAQRGPEQKFRRGTEAGRRTRRENLRGRGKGRRSSSDDVARGGFSGPGPDEKDPQLVGDLLAGYVSKHGWDRPLAEARVFSDWASLVGPDIAAHCAPTSLQDGELKVSAESTAWATQLRMLGSTILAKMVAELGPQTVRKIIFTGPSGPSWKHGLWSVRGSRGPRDTYG